MVYLEKCGALIESKNFITPESATMSEPLYLAKSEDGYPALLPQMANRHGLITGATGTGKTVTLQRLAELQPERMIDAAWGQQKDGVFSVDIVVQAQDRTGLLRDISEVFAKEKMNVVGVKTQSVKGTAWMTFTVEVSDASLLKRVMQSVKSVSGVGQVRRN